MFLQSCTHAKKVIPAANISEALYYKVDDFASVEKFDTHVHLNTYDTQHIKQAQSDTSRLFDIWQEQTIAKI